MKKLIVLFLLALSVSSAQAQSMDQIMSVLEDGAASPNGLTIVETGRRVTKACSNGYVTEVSYKIYDGSTLVGSGTYTKKTGKASKNCQNVADASS